MPVQVDIKQKSKALIPIHNAAVGQSNCWLNIVLCLEVKVVEFLYCG